MPCAGERAGRGRLAAARRRRQRTAQVAIDTRAICLIRETLARHSGLADFAFAMQGLGSGAISLQGTSAQKEHYLPRVARGEAIAAFALSEPDAGSDVAAMQCSARIEGDHAVLDGEKTWISNGGIADFYVVFARTGEAPGARGISAFIVDAGTPGFEIAERIEVIAPHPLARLRFTQLPGAADAAHRWGRRGLQGGDAHAGRVPHLGGRRRAGLRAPCAGRGAAARHHAASMFNQALADFQLTQAKLAQMATTIDSAALLVYRAAWQRDQGRGVTKEAAMAKLSATEGAQQVIDAAVQIFGGLGVVSGAPGGDAVPRNPRAAHLRRRDRSAAADHRPRTAERHAMNDMEVILPEGWPRPRAMPMAFSRSGRMLSIAGMIGWDAQGAFHSDDFADQARQALQNVADVLREAGGKPENIVRMTWYVTDKREYLAAGRRSARPSANSSAATTSP